MSNTNSGSTVRGSGRTTNQFRNASDQSLFIWCSDYPDDAGRIAMTGIGGTYNKVMRTWTKPNGDRVRIVPRSALSFNGAERLRGYQFSEIIIDHALRSSENRYMGTTETIDVLAFLQNQIRPNP